MSASRFLPPALIFGLLLLGPGTLSADSPPREAARAGECLFPAHDLRLAFGSAGDLTATRGRAPDARTWSLALAGAPADIRFRCVAGGLEETLEILPSPVDGTVPALVFHWSGTLAPKVSDDGRTVRLAGAPGDPNLLLRDLLATDASGRDVGAFWQRVEGPPPDGPALRLLLDMDNRLLPIRVGIRLAPAKGFATSSAASSGADRNGPAVLAAPPVNDTCPLAEAIPGGGPFPALSSAVDVTGATSAGDPSSPACQADVSHGVWFSFAPAAAGDYAFSVCADAPSATTVEDTVLAVYDLGAGCAAPIPMANGCSDDACGAGGLQSSVAPLALAAGHSYAAVVWIYGAAAPPAGSSDVQLRVERIAPTAPPPSNDRCEAAEIIPGAGPFPLLTAVTPDISGATADGDPPLPSCQPSVSRSVWYRFIPAAPGRYLFSVCADAPTGTTVDDTVLAVYADAGSCSGLVEMPGGCDDDSCAGEAAQSRSDVLDLAAGQTYDVVVWKYGNAPPPAGDTAIQLRVEQVLAPANDACLSAAALALERPRAGTTAFAADDVRLPAGAACFAGPGQVASTAPGRDAVYRFTAPDAGRFSFRATPAGGNGNLVVYAAADCPVAATPGTVTTCLGAANRSATQPEEIDCLPLAAGQVIHLIVDEDTTTAGVPFLLEGTRCHPESEPNGTPETGGPVPCLSEGSIAPAGDADFYALGSPAPSSRAFAIVDGAAAGGGDFDLRVTTATDTLEYDDFNNDAPFGSSAPNVAGTPLPGGPAFLRVSHYSAAAQSSPYRLCAVVRPPASQAQPETEPNDALATATTGPDGWFAGTLGAAGDIDLFAFEAAPGELLHLGLDLDPLRNATAWNGSLALLDANGAGLLVVNDTSSTASTLSGAGSLTATTPFAPGEALLYRVRTGGTYFARVAGSSGTPGDYLLSIARHPASGPVDGDGDGVADASDCAVTDPEAWTVPGEATGLRFAPGSSTALEWTQPADPGGTMVRYDLLRSARPDDWSGGLCLAVGATATLAADSAQPTGLFFYLVRARNACGGNLGARSDGTLRVAPACP